MKSFYAFIFISVSQNWKKMMAQRSEHVKIVQIMLSFKKETYTLDWRSENEVLEIVLPTSEFLHY